jgi:hypothetical protein
MGWKDDPVIQSGWQSDPVVGGKAAKPLEWSDVPGQALTNLPESAGKFVGGIYEAVTSPIETAKTIGMAAAGGLKNILPKSVTDFITSISSEPGKINEAVAIAEEAMQGWDDLREDLAASVERPCDADPTIVSLRARLDALVEQHNNGGES